MSYARFGWNNSDVYVFTTSLNNNPPQYALDCCGCILDQGEELETPYTDMFGIEHTRSYAGFKALTSGEMIAHLKKHQSLRHNVNEETLKEILSDYPDENKPITEYETEKDSKTSLRKNK